MATPLTRALAPVEPYQRPEPLQSFRGSNKVIVPGIRPESNKKAAPKKIRLSEYHMSKVNGRRGKTIQIATEIEL